jgi:hypothetical protein
MTEEIAVYEPKEINQLSPIEMAQSFLKSGGDIANLEKMLALQEKYDAMQAKKAFIKAMAKFKETPIIIGKDKENKQYNSKYSSIGIIVNSCLPRMGLCGLSHKWEFDSQADHKFLTGKCIVTHCEGHSDSVSMTAPIDVSGAKNPIQQIKSTRTYIKIETFTSLMGLTSSETDLDDDGNNSGKTVLLITEKQAIEIRDIIESIEGFSETDFLEWAKKESIESICACDYQKAKIALSARAKAAKK